MNKKIIDVINSITIDELINFDYNESAENLDVDLDESDLTLIREDWIDFDEQLKIIKKVIIKKLKSMDV